MAARGDIKTRLLATFQVEAEEHVQTLTGNLLALGREPPPGEVQELVEATFRVMHTLKGAARSVGLTDVESLCQSCELVLNRLARGRLAPAPAIVEALGDAVAGVPALLAGRIDAEAARELGRRVELAAAGTDERPQEPIAIAPTAPPPAPAETAATGTIRVDAGKLDALLRQGEELLAVKLAAGERAREARSLVAELVRSSDREPAAAGRALLDNLTRDRQATATAVDGLLEEIRRARMMPASTVLDLFPGMVREIAREQGKDVEWSVRGSELEVDRRVLETIKDPLIHLVRNSIDHGIEPPGERVAAGKDPRGRVSVALFSPEAGRIEIVIEDDGRGIDPADVRDAAVRGRLVTAEAAAALGDAEVFDFVFRSGLSTSPVITAVSGHGLGLAIVREQVERLGGELQLDSRAGGTRIRLLLPASIATFHGLLVRSAAQHFLLPVQATEQVLSVDSDEIKTVEGREAIEWRGRPLPLARLDAVLQLPAPARADGAAGSFLVVVASGQERSGLLVDEVLGEQEVLVKDLSLPLVRVRHIAAAGLLGSGQIVLILRATDLVRAGRSALRPATPRVAAVEEGRAPRVLVVDDAVTTRTMERNLLEAAGYEVEVAVDGEDAWTVLKTGEFDLVVSDVDMPRMNGFELTARIRGDARLDDLPVVLVTALESREDKERGVAVGANAYVVKSSFEQSNLLEIIRRLGVVPAGRGEP